MGKFAFPQHVNQLILPTGEQVIPDDNGICTVAHEHNMHALAAGMIPLPDDPPPVVDIEALAPVDEDVTGDGGAQAQQDAEAKAKVDDDEDDDVEPPHIILPDGVVAKDEIK